MKNQNWKVIIIVLVLLVVWFGYVVVTRDVKPAPSSPQPEEEDEATFKNFSNNEFGVSFTYPRQWEISEKPLFDSTTALNAFKPGSLEMPPYTHHNNVTNISFFPHGIPTEGLMAPTKPIDFELGFETEHAVMFTLEDGTPFAAYIRPKNLPHGWDEAGFIWVRAHLENLSTTCTDMKGESVPEERCDPLTEGHQILWKGDRDDYGWQEAIQILKSIQFAQ